MLEINKDGDRSWYNAKKEYHRKNGPAIEWHDGYKKWYRDGQLHREDGPAIEYVNGDREWYLEGVQYSEEEYRKRVKDYV